MAKETPVYMFCITLLEETARRNRSSLMTQPETLLPLHGIQILDGTSVRNDATHDRLLLHEVHVRDG